MLHYFSIFIALRLDRIPSSLTPERARIVKIKIIGKIGTRVTSFTEDYTIADLDLYTWFCWLLRYDFMYDFHNSTDIFGEILQLTFAPCLWSQDLILYSGTKIP